MKSKSFFSNVLIASCVAAAGLAGLSSCDKNNDDNNNNMGDGTYTLSGNASGTQEVPSNTTTGSATMNGTYNSSTNTLVYTVDWSGITGPAIAAHLHGPAETGVSAGVLLPLNVLISAVTGQAKDSVVIADSVETSLLSGKVYYNIHTAAYPDGEIRGQVTAVKQQNN